MSSSPAPTSIPRSSSLDNTSQPRAASRIIISVRRSLSSKRHGRSHSQSMHMYSTPEERSPASSLATFREAPSASARPSIEQIAMGLHVSRTPHLHSSPRLQYPRPASHSHFSSSSSPPSFSPRPPLKKSSVAGSSESSPALSPLSYPPSASASSSTITSASMQMIAAASMSASAPVSPRLQQHHGGGGSALATLKLRMARLLPREKRRSASSPPALIVPAHKVDRQGTVHTTAAITRKAVRFESLASQRADSEQHR